MVMLHVCNCLAASFRMSSRGRKSHEAMTLISTPILRYEVPLRPCRSECHVRMAQSRSVSFSMYTLHTAN